MKGQTFEGGSIELARVIVGHRYSSNKDQPSVC